jgi:hypothetical protein
MQARVAGYPKGLSDNTYFFTVGMVSCAPTNLYSYRICNSCSGGMQTLELYVGSSRSAWLIVTSGAPPPGCSQHTYSCHRHLAV